MENRQVITALPAAPKSGPSYPALQFRLWLVQSRLYARAQVRRIWRFGSADDRRLAAVLVSTLTAFIVFLGCVIFGATAATAITLVGIALFTVLGCSLALLFGPDDYDCNDELATVTQLLPGAKQAWDDRRAVARAARAARKSARAAWVADLRAARALQRAEQAARTQAQTLSISAEEFVELVPSDEQPAWPARAPMALKGNGDYAVPVLGEVHVSRILADVCNDSLPPLGQNKDISAIVQFENTNRNSGAVSVQIGGRKVGYLSRADARALRRQVDQESEKFKCRANIQADWKGGRVNYAVRLDVNLAANSPSGVVGSSS